MLYSDHELATLIARGIVSGGKVQPASIDLTLGDEIRVFDPQHIGPIDPQHPPRTYGLRLNEEYSTREYRLMPGEFILGTTDEYLHLTRDMAAHVEGKSGLGRLGLAVHATAGFVDPGFHGQLTLEISNIGPFTIRLTPGMYICQLTIEKLTSPAQYPYGHPSLNSHYQNQWGPTPAREV